MLYLGGDIGGTKTHLALYEDREGKMIKIRDQKYLSQKYSHLTVVVKEFLKGKEGKIRCACFGVAGPVKQGKIQATNLPWLIEEKSLSRELEIEKVVLINDLEANAYGLKTLSDEEFYVLNKGNLLGDGNQALISAGTGLGEAGLYFDGKEHHPFASEGGHGDFAPRSDLEDELLKYLRKKFNHVSYERILSGPGLYNVYRFLLDTKKESEKGDILQEIESGDSPFVISDFGIRGLSSACVRTLELFVSIYGAEAGNMALKMFAMGGVFVGGGIAPKILEVFQKGGFMKGFIEKGRFSDFLKEISVKVVLNEHTALLGSVHFARNLSGK